jgi:hypothetical protein
VSFWTWCEPVSGWTWCEPVSGLMPGLASDSNGHTFSGSVAGIGHSGIPVGQPLLKFVY